MNVNLSASWDLEDLRHEKMQAHVVPIILDRMPQQIKVQKPNDDWTGLSNQAERKRRQNRLNQRAYRRRKEAQLQQHDLTSTSQDNESSKSSPSIKEDHMHEYASKRQGPAGDYDTQDTGPWAQFSSAISSMRPQIDQLTKVAVMSKIISQRSDKTIQQFQRWVYQDHMIGSPTRDHVLVLIKYNIFRAMVINSNSLGFEILEHMDDNALSPFTPKSKFENHLNPHLTFSSIPLALQPTDIQCEIPHHPWIDLLPIPKMRDNLILAGDEYDEVELCGDLCGLFNSPNSRNGLIIWGDPWDTKGWEMTPWFMSKWAWTVKGCDELMVSTNFWRQKRGLRQLDFRCLTDEKVTEIC